MRSTRWVLSVIWLVVLLPLPSALAFQDVAPFPAPTDYAVKIPDDKGKPAYHPVIAAAGGDAGIFYSFKRIANWQRPPSQTEDANAYQLAFRRDGDAVEIKLSVLYVRPQKGPIFRTAPSGGFSEPAVATYRARLGESVTLQELADFGIEPVTVEVVSARAHSVNPARIINRTKAIEVVKVDRARELYRLSIRNASSKNIIAWRLCYPAADIPCGGTVGDLKPVLTPGQSLETQLGITKCGRLTPQGVSVPDANAPVRIAIGGVVFEDLTYEGDKDFAMSVVAGRRGEQIQIPRILSLIEPAITTPGSESREAREKLSQQLSALSVEIDPRVVEEVVKRFAPTTELQRTQTYYALRNGLDRKNWIAVAVKFFERIQPDVKTTYQNYLREVKEHFEAKLKLP